MEPQGNSLKGIITDSSKAPIIGAIVTIPDLKTGATTDINGAFSINNLPKGKYLVEVHMLSFNTLTTNVIIDGTTTKNFTLTESILERSEVVITGSSLATEQRKNTTPIVSVRLKELQENAATNIIDAIAKLPGVSQVTTGPAISKPVIRGLGANRMLVINDGVRQEGQQWGDEHGIEIDDYNVSKIEILKGPASLAYGSDALAGVINIISDDHLPGGKTSGNVSLNYQTNDGLALAHAKLDGNQNGFNWGGYITGKIAHDYQNKYDGYVFNSRFNNINYGANIGLNKQWGYSKLSFTSFNQNLGIAEGERDSATGAFIKIVNDNGNQKEEITTGKDNKSYKSETPFQNIKHQKIIWNNNFNLHNGARLGLILGYQQNTRKEFVDVVNQDKAGLYFLLSTYSYDLKYIFPIIKGWQITTGVNGMLQKDENKGTEFLIPDYQLFDAGIYTVARKDINKWSLSGGVRYDFRNVTAAVLYLDSDGHRTNYLQNNGAVKFNAFERNFSNVTGSVGASYLLNEKISFKVNAASGYRAPNIAELSANGVHEGTLRYEYGNNNLKAENSFQGDLGMEYKSDHVYLNAAVFYNYITHFIFIRKLAGAHSIDSIPNLNNEDGEPAFIYDQGNANLYGGEFYMDFHPHPLDWLHLENTFSYVRGKNINSTDSTKNLPYMPPAKWLIELRAQKKSFNYWLKNCYIKIGMDATFDQSLVYNAYETETATAGYVIFNAGFGFEVASKKQKTVCTAIIAAQNLLDTPYQNHLSRLKYAPENLANGREGIYNMGRNISVLLSFPLEF